MKKGLFERMVTGPPPGGRAESSGRAYLRAPASETRRRAVGDILCIPAPRGIEHVTQPSAPDPHHRAAFGRDRSVVGLRREVHSPRPPPCQRPHRRHARSRDCCPAAAASGPRAATGPRHAGARSARIESWKPLFVEPYEPDAAAVAAIRANADDVDRAAHRRHLVPGQQTRSPPVLRYHGRSGHSRITTDDGGRGPNQEGRRGSHREVGRHARSDIRVPPERPGSRPRRGEDSGWRNP